MKSFIGKTLRSILDRKELSREFFTLRRSKIRLLNYHDADCFRLELDWRWHCWCSIGMLVIATPFLSTFQISASLVNQTSENLVLTVLLVIAPTVLLASRILFYKPKSDEDQDEPFFRSSKRPNNISWIIFLPLMATIAICICLNILRTSIEISPAEASFSMDFHASSGIVTVSVYALLWVALYWHSRIAERFTLTILTDVYQALPLEARHQIDLALPTDQVNPKPTWEWRHVIDLPYAFYLNAISLAMFKAPQAKSAFRHNLGFVVWYLAPVYLPLLALLIAPFSMDWAKPQYCLDAKNIDDYFCKDKSIKFCYAEAMILWAVWATTYYLMLSKKHFLRQENPQPIYALAVFGLLKDSSLSEMSRYFENMGLAIAALFILSIMPIYFDYLGLFG